MDDIDAARIQHVIGELEGAAFADINHAYATIIESGQSEIIRANAAGFLHVGMRFLRQAINTSHLPTNESELELRRIEIPKDKSRWLDERA